MASKLKPRSCHPEGDPPASRILLLAGWQMHPVTSSFSPLQPPHAPATLCEALSSSKPPWSHVDTLNSDVIQSSSPDRTWKVRRHGSAPASPLSARLGPLLSSSLTSSPPSRRPLRVHYSFLDWTSVCTHASLPTMSSPFNQGRDSPGQYSGNTFTGNPGYSQYSAAHASELSAQSAAAAAAATSGQVQTSLSFGSTAATILPSSTTDAAGSEQTTTPPASTDSAASASTDSTDTPADSTTTGGTTSTNSALATPFANILSSQTTFDTSTTPANSFSQSPTSLHASLSSTPGAAAASNSLPETEHAHHPTISHGGVAAAVLVPILLALAVLLAAFLCLRRRSKQGRAPFLPVLREKLGGGSSARTPATPMAAAPVLMSERNNAYFTGLDTSSRGSQSQREENSGEYYAPARRSEGGTFADPPPPYKAKSMKSQESAHSSNPSDAPAVPQLPPMAVIPALREPSEHSSSDPFDDPATPTTPTGPAGGNGLLASPAGASLERPQTSRSTTARSFTSTLYSDTASVHSAQAARLSVAGAQMIAAAPSQSTLTRIHTSNDPFGDPDSPVSRMSGEGEEWHSSTNSTPRS